MMQALKEKDEETRKELEEETRKLQEQMNKMRRIRRVWRQTTKRRRRGWRGDEGRCRSKLVRRGNEPRPRIGNRWRISTGVFRKVLMPLLPREKRCSSESTSCSISGIIVLVGEVDASLCSES
jgi:hypothetical protein